MILNSFLSLYGFWVQKCKNERFEENKVYVFSCFGIKAHVVTNRFKELEKKLCGNFAYDIFYEFSKLSHFPRFFLKIISSPC